MPHPPFKRGTETVVKLSGELPRRRRLRAGPLSAILEAGQLRDTRWHGVEAMRGAWSMRGVGGAEGLVGDGVVTQPEAVAILRRYREDGKKEG